MQAKSEHPRFSALPKFRVVKPGLLSELVDWPASARCGSRSNAYRRPPSGSKWRPAYFFKPPRDADSNPNSLNFAFLRKAATRSIRCLAGEFRRDVGVNQVSLHRLISRPVSLSRSKLGSVLKSREGKFLASPVHCP